MRNGSRRPSGRSPPTTPHSWPSPPTVRQAPSPAELLTSAKKKMFVARAKRVRPHLDDKVLASWNGLMLGAMARAGIVLGDETYLLAAEKNATFLKAKLWDANT